MTNAGRIVVVCCNMQFWYFDVWKLNLGSPDLEVFNIQHWINVLTYVILLCWFGKHPFVTRHLFEYKTAQRNRQIWRFFHAILVKVTMVNLMFWLWCKVFRLHTFSFYIYIHKTKLSTPTMVRPLAWGRGWLDHKNLFHLGKLRTSFVFYYIFSILHKPHHLDKVITPLVAVPVPFVAWIIYGHSPSTKGFRGLVVSAVT